MYVYVPVYDNLPAALPAVADITKNHNIIISPVTSDDVQPAPATSEAVMHEDNAGKSTRYLLVVLPVVLERVRNLGDDETY